MRVYIAGPLGPNNGTIRIANVNRAIDAGIEIALAGHSPFVPHLTHFFETRGRVLDLRYEDYMRIDFDFLASCGTMVRLSGVSPGADRESIYAAALGIPVFETVGEAILYANSVEKK